MADVIIADEYPLVRQALRHCLEEDGHRVVVEFDNGRDALLHSQREAPALLILDLTLPRLGGLEVARQLRHEGNAVPVLIYTGRSNEHYASLCLQAGCSGFVAKQADVEILKDAIRALLRGHRFFPERSLGTVAPGLDLRSEGDQLGSLSPRELTVLRYLANGWSNRQIADDLALNDRTVSTYKARLQQKLNVGSLAELVEFAWRNGLLKPMAGGGAAAGQGRQESCHDLFRQLFDAMPMPVSLRDKDGVLLACNRKFQEVHGLTGDSAIGTTLPDIPGLDPREASRLHQRYLDAVSREQPYDAEIEFQLNGKRTVLRAWGVPYRDEAGAMLGMLCSSVDITDHDTELAALSDSRQNLIAVRRNRTLFLNDSGEALLRKVEAALHLVRQLEVPAQHAASLDEVRRYLMEIQLFLDTLLDIVRIERGSLMLVPRVAELGELSGKIVDECNRKRRERGSLPVSVNGAGRGAMAWVDVQRYRQMLLALLHYIETHAGSAQHMGWRLQQTLHTEQHWCLEIGDEPMPGGVFHEPWPDQSDLALALSGRLARLMNGSLTLCEWDDGRQTIRVVLRLAQALQSP
ncbi:Transcriptional regulatory protein RcsB [compost metagenome]